MIKYETSDEKIQPFLPASIDTCQKAVRWAYKQSSELLIMLQEDEKSNYFKFKSRNLNLTNEELSLMSSYSSAFNIRKLIEKKNIDDIKDIDRLGIVQELDIAKHRRNRKRPKYEKLLNNKSKIKDMLKKGYSLRIMSNYFRTKKLIVSHSFIADFIKEQKDIK